MPDDPSEPLRAVPARLRGAWKALAAALVAAGAALAGPAPSPGAGLGQQPEEARAQEANTGPVSHPVLRPVLRIGGEEIGADEFGRWLIDNLGGRAARSFAADWVVEREASRRNVAVSEDEIRARWEEEIRARIEGAFRGRKEAWLEELARTGRSEEGLRRQREVELRSELLARALVSIDRVVPEDILEREWELRHGRKGRKYELLLMKFQCVFTTPAAPEGEAAQERDVHREAEIRTQLERAQAARERLLSGADFGTLAAQLSDDPLTRDNRGALPAGFSHFGWPQSFLDALDGLAPGEISEPLYARGGWWLARLKSVVVTPLESVREALVEELLARGPDQLETGRYRAALESRMSVQVLPSLYETGPASEESPEPPAALSIDGEKVARSTYALWLLRTRGEASVSHFAEHWVVLQRARARGLEASDQEARARAEEFLRTMIQVEHKGQREAWLAQLARSGRDEAGFLRELTNRMRIEVLTEKLYKSERSITPEQVRARWEAVYGARGRSVRARLLLLRIPLPPAEPPLNRDELERRLGELSEAVRQRAEELARRLQAGEDFATLARQHSEEPVSAAEGGLLPDRFRPERWPKEVADAVQGLQTGEISPPLDLKTAWALFQVVSAKEVRFEDVEQDLREQMEQEPVPPSELAAYRNSLLRQTSVEVLPELNR